ncbi:MAG: LysM peptidoglycan-binding domain-containing protein [Clostridia bacterium]|nr:LysM peptidoglycan-binding domain-containing protein [Clostridia bacterium]
MDFEYCVENFDTIESISNRFDVSVDAIVELNHITGSLPKVLKIPVQSKGGYAVLLNFKREYLAFKNSDKVRTNLAKLNLYGNDDDVCLYRPKDNSIYIVGVLDSLNGICEKFKVDKEEIKKLNNLKTDKLFIGQMLKLCK